MAVTGERKPATATAAVNSRGLAGRLKSMARTFDHMPETHE